MNKRYTRVTDVVQAMDIPADQKKRQIDYIKARQLSRMLTVMRAHNKLSQKQAAEKLAWSQGRVSKLEAREDRTIAVGDLLDYANMLDLEMSIVFLPRKMKIADRVKMHAHEMFRLLQKLVKLSAGDDAFEKGVAQFHDECWQNLTQMVGFSKQSIRTPAKKELTVIGPDQLEKLAQKEPEHVSC